MKRSKHTLSHYRMITGNMGNLMPLSAIPVLPGDTFQGHTSALIRLSPLNTPVMHPTVARIHHFYVPNRIIWSGWEDFITGGLDGQDTNTPPTITVDGGLNRMSAYLGVPAIAGTEINALPIRALNAIINEYYRDQDLEGSRDPDSDNSFRVSWEKDYFTTARPWTQKGPDVTLPLGESADVRTAAAINESIGVYSDGEAGYHQMDTTAGFLHPDAAQNQAEENKLYADLANAQSPSVNDFRAAFSLQRYQEARARYGARFTEYLRYLGVTPSDARLQRPEFLGGGTTRLNFSEVLQTTPNDDGLGVADLYGHGIAGLKSNRYRKFFEEHGYVVTVMSVRPKSIYMNGLHREWIKKTKEDYYQKELANLGQQEVYKQEVYAGADSDEIFGYQDRYDEYRSHPSQVSQEFRTTLNAWHMARELDDSVTLNNLFTRCDPSKRIFQVESEDTLWIMANNHIVARRMVPKKANPRII